MCRCKPGWQRVSTRYQKAQWGAPLWITWRWVSDARKTRYGQVSQAFADGFDDQSSAARDYVRQYGDDVFRRGPGWESTMVPKREAYRTEWWRWGRLKWRLPSHCRRRSMVNDMPISLNTSAIFPDQMRVAKHNKLRIKQKKKRQCAGVFFIRFHSWVIDFWTLQPHQK